MVQIEKFYTFPSAGRLVFQVDICACACVKIWFVLHHAVALCGNLSLLLPSSDKLKCQTMFISLSQTASTQQCICPYAIPLTWEGIHTTKSHTIHENGFVGSITAHCAWLNCSLGTRMEKNMQKGGELASKVEWKSYLDRHHLLPKHSISVLSSFRSSPNITPIVWKITLWDCLGFGWVAHFERCCCERDNYTSLARQRPEWRIAQTNAGWRE